MSVNIIKRSDPDEHWVDPWVIWAVPDGIDPQGVINTLKEQDQNIRTWLSLARTFDEAWREQNPMPEMDRSGLKERVVWKSGLRKEEITDEMRAERKAIEDHNHALYQAHGEVVDAWHERHKAALESWLDGEEWFPKELRETVLEGHFYRPEYEYHAQKLEFWRGPEII